MSTFNSSLVLEEIKKSKNHLVNLLPGRYSIMNHKVTDTQHQVVKISGHITVSF